MYKHKCIRQAKCQDVSLISALLAVAVRSLQPVCAIMSTDAADALRTHKACIAQNASQNSEETALLVCNHKAQCMLLAGLMKELQAAQKQISDLRSEVAQAQLPLLITKAETLPSGARLLAAQVDGMDAKSLQVASCSCLSTQH